jgi:hypothetical protein
MSKDGPPSSGGYRFGAVDAFHSGLPADAANPRGKVTTADAEKRQNLAKFAAYPERAKSFGKQIPITKRMREHSAKAQRLAEQEKRTERDIDRLRVEKGKDTDLWLYKVRDENGWHWYFVEENKVTGLRRKSKRYWSRPRWAYENKYITWVGYI